MWGSATLAMEVSSTSMKVARVTVMATAQGLWLGRQRGLAPGAASLIEPSRWITERPGRKSAVLVEVGLVAIDQIDADGNALHHFDVVSGGVLGGQQAELGPSCAADAGDPAVELLSAECVHA